MKSLVKIKQLAALSSLIFIMQGSFAQDNIDTNVKLSSIDQIAGTWSCESTGRTSSDNAYQLEVKEHGIEQIDKNGVSHADLVLDTTILTAKATIRQNVSTYSDGIYRLQDSKLIDRLTHNELVSYKTDGLEDQTKVKQMRESFIVAMNHDIENKKEAAYTVTRFTGDQWDFTDNEDNSIVINGTCKRTAL